MSSDENSIKKISPVYSLTDGLTLKSYNNIIDKVLKNIPDLDEWLSRRILKQFNFITWKKAILDLHNPKNVNKKGDFLNRLIFDEIFSNFLINSNIRQKIKKTKKLNKVFDDKPLGIIKEKINFKLTNDQLKSIEQINLDLRSNKKMFRLLQGDVGSGKTIVALITSLNVIFSNFQVCLMAPTEILAKQHYNLTKKLFPKDIEVELLTGKTDYSVEKNYQKFRN